MIKYFCDRCHDQVEDEESLFVVIAETPAVEWKIDACNACASQFNFMCDSWFGKK